MRKFLINYFKKENLPFAEAEILPEDVLQASEVFLTNALYGIRWVEKTGLSNYTNSMSAFLHQKVILPLFTA
jgi:branched-chain amino acid aminotransferase